MFHPSQHSAYGYGGTALATGYYDDGGGYAWYYNADEDYFDLIAVPSKSEVKKRTRYKSGDKIYDAAVTNATSRTVSTKDLVLGNAKRAGGKELPDPDDLGANDGKKPEASPVKGAGLVAPAEGRRGGGRMRQREEPPKGLSTGQMVGIGAAGVALLVGLAFAVRVMSK
jgi:D-alanyl-D-alanine carboxypeptidase